MHKEAKIFVAGHRGLVGGAIVRTLQDQGYTNLVLKTREELDLLDHGAVKTFFAKERPDYVFLAAAKVGGIMANKTYPADFAYQNLTIQTNIINSAHETGVRKLLFLGSSCIYPRSCPQPIKESYLLTGELEPTNKAYAVAKIAGITLCQSYAKQYADPFISVMPTNLYGPGDDFSLEQSHVMPAMIAKFHRAKVHDEPEVVLWGTGNALREFLYVDDLAHACVFLMNTYSDPEVINIGTGEDLSIKDLAEKVREVVGYTGKITWDTSKPDGTPRKLLDVGKLHELGWKHTTPLETGITKTYEWFTQNYE